MSLAVEAKPHPPEETAAGSWPRFLSAETADSAIQILTGAFTPVRSSGARLQAARSRSAQIAPGTQSLTQAKVDPK